MGDGTGAGWGSEGTRAGGSGGAHLAALSQHAVQGPGVGVRRLCPPARRLRPHARSLLSGAGFEIAEAEHRQTIPLSDGGSAETFTGTFRKTGTTLRIFWTYGIRSEENIEKEDIAAPRTWIAPQIARIALVGEPAVYKMYAIVDETRLSSSQAMVECEDLLANLLPSLEGAIGSYVSAPENGSPPGDAPAETERTKPQETALSTG